eukprot:231913-Alexandrium_andersonii.AAC.1
MAHQLTEYMQKHNIHVLLLQETRVPNTTQYISGDYQFIMIGNGQNIEYAGIGFIVSLRVRPAIAGIRVASNRLALVRFRTGPGEVQLVNVYIPQSGRPEEERHQVFDDLSDLTEEEQT